MPPAAANPDIDDALAKLEASLLDVDEDEVEIEEEEEVEAENEDEFAAEEAAKDAGKKGKGASKSATLKEVAADEDDEWDDVPAAPEKRPAGKAGKAGGKGPSKGKKGAPSTPPAAEEDDEFEDVLVDAADDDDLDMAGGDVDANPAALAEKPAAKGKGKDKGKTKTKAVAAAPAEDEESEDFDDIVEEDPKAAKGTGKKGKGKGGKARLVAEADESDTDSEQFDEPIRGPTGKGGKKGKDGKKGGPTGKILKGWVKRFMEERGFGFLVPEDGSEELFFHCMCLDNLPEGQGIDPGHYIHFTKIAQEDGRFKATWVKLVKGGPPMPAKYGGGAGKGKKGKGDGKDKDKDKGKGTDKDGKGKGKDAWWWDEWDWWGKGKKGWGKGWDEQGEERPAKVARTSSSGDPATPAEWQAAQDRLFGHMKPVPAPWIRIRSKSSGSIYLYNTKTGDSKATDGEDLSAPLPGNWSTKTSSSGKTYYYNSNTGESTFERPS